MYFKLFDFFLSFLGFFQSQVPANLLQGLLIGYYISPSGNRKVFSVLTSRILAIFLIKLAFPHLAPPGSKKLSAFLKHLMWLVGRLLFFFLYFDVLISLRLGWRL